MGCQSPPSRGSGRFRSRNQSPANGVVALEFFLDFAPRILQKWCKTSLTRGWDDINLSTSVQNILKKNEKKACQASKT
jgi:hypothetical protein